MRVSSASFAPDGAGGVACPHPAAGRLRRRLAVALHRRPTPGEAGSRDRPRAGARGRHGAPYSPVAARPARRSRSDGGLPAGARNPGTVRRARAGIDLGSKRWPYYRELAERLAGSVGIVVVGGPEDAGLAAEITAAVARSGGHAVSGCRRLTVRQSAEAIRRAAVLVTNDSAPLHVAQAVGTPTVAIFGSTAPSFGFGPRGPRDRVVELEGLPCRPCSAHGPPSCPLGHHRCMRSLPVEDVLDATEETGAH